MLLGVLMIWAWQVAFCLIIAGLFYFGPVTAWVRQHSRARGISWVGYVFGTVYAFAAVLLIDLTFTNTPLPRFEDIFLAGIALTAYLFSTGPAVYLLVVGFGISVWFLPPVETFYIADPVDWYRLASFLSISILLLFVIARLKVEAKRNYAFPAGYVFATAYAAIATVVALITFHSQPLPRFMDIFLVGIGITAYFFAITPAAYLLALSVAVSAWILPPTGSFAISRPEDWYRLLSFTAVAGLLIFLTGRLKKWRGQTAGALSRN